MNDERTDEQYPLACVAILNWNGWGDTIECLESVFQQTYPNYCVVVCDNGSTDGSLEYIKMWAQGHLDVGRPPHEALRDLSYPPIAKPIPYSERSAHRGGGRDHLAGGNERLVLLSTGENFGFAGGYNIALRDVLSSTNAHYVWLLNNDTTVTRDALAALVSRMQCKPCAGMCGSTLLHFADPARVQALGGAHYNRFFGTHQHLGSGTSLPEYLDVKAVEKRLSYIVAASMCVSTQFLRDVGPMSEDYFLYFEEIDWAVRAKGSYTLAYAANSIVYHKGGASTGSKGLEKRAEYIALRNRLFFTYKRLRWAFPFVWISFFGVALNRLRRGQPDRLVAIAKIMFGGWRRLPS